MQVFYYLDKVYFVPVRAVGPSWPDEGGGRRVDQGRGGRLQEGRQNVEPRRGQDLLDQSSGQSHILLIWEKIGENQS